MRATLALLAFAVLLPADLFGQGRDLGRDDRNEACVNSEAFTFPPSTWQPRLNQSTLYPGSAAESSYSPHTYAYLPPASHPNVQWFIRFRNIDNYHHNRNQVAHIAFFDDAGELVQEARIGIEANTIRGISAASLPDLASGLGIREHDAFVRHAHVPMPGPNELLWARIQVSYGALPMVFLRILSGDGEGFLSRLHPTETHPNRHGYFNINPASNHKAVGIVRLVNPKNEPNIIALRAWDDQNQRNDPGEIVCEIAPCGALTLTAQQLERGTAACAGSFGDGKGKWAVLSHGYPDHRMDISFGIRNSALGLFSQYLSEY